MLESKHALSEAVLARLEAFIASERSAESIDWKQHMDIVEELLSSLCIMCTVTSRLTWEKAERYVKAFFLSVLSLLSHSHHVILIVLYQEAPVNCPPVALCPFLI